CTLFNDDYRLRLRDRDRVDHRTSWEGQWSYLRRKRQRERIERLHGCVIVHVVPLRFMRCPMCMELRIHMGVDYRCVVVIRMHVLKGGQEIGHHERVADRERGDATHLL